MVITHTFVFKHTISGAIIKKRVFASSYIEAYRRATVRLDPEYIRVKHILEVRYGQG